MMVGKKEKRNVCVTSGFQLIMLIHRRGVSKPAKRSSISFFRRFILPSPPPSSSSPPLLSFPLTASRRKGGGGGKVKIQRYYFSHAHTRPRMYMCVSHVHSMTVYQSKKGFLSSALNKGRSPLHRFPSSASISWLAHSPPSPPSCCINIHGYNVESG